MGVCSCRVVVRKPVDSSGTISCSLHTSRAHLTRDQDYRTRWHKDATKTYCGGRSTRMLYFRDGGRPWHIQAPFILLPHVK